MANRQLVIKLKSIRRMLIKNRIKVPLLGTKEGEKFLGTLCDQLAGIDKAHIVKREVRRLITRFNAEEQYVSKSDKINRRYVYRKFKPI